MRRIAWYWDGSFSLEAFCTEEYVAVAKREACVDEEEQVVLY
eukprot:COSAG02_NODE_52076_length_310_cov_0.729858_1_plen_42_part_00